MYEFILIILAPTLIAIAGAAYMTDNFKNLG
jgi:hypothetical protein